MVDQVPPREATPGPLRIAFVAAEERAALRTFIRALRRLGTGVDWEATVLGAMGSSSQASLRADLRARVSFLDDADSARAALLERADVVVLASGGAAAGARAGARGDRRARRAARVAPGGI